MPRFKLTIEYAGTRYSGWQIQKNARTVAGEIDRAVRKVTERADFELYGAGRTDAGVHALAQVAHLDVSTRLPPASLVRQLNDELPSDIHILSAEIVPHRFHARHDAASRTYLYQIARRRTAFAKNYVWWVKEPLDLADMRAGASAFLGMRDFRAFAHANVERSSAHANVERSSAHANVEKSFAPADADDDDKGSTRVLIDRLDIVEDGDLVLFGIEGSHFLWRMVRRIVGVLVEIGRGGLAPADAGRFLTEPSDAPAKLTAPASGLFLARVAYKGDRVDPARLGLVAATPVRSQ